MIIQNQTRGLIEKQIKTIIRKSSVGPKNIITNIYREAGYSVVRSFSDFPRKRKQISNIRYTEKPLSKLVNIW